MPGDTFPLAVLISCQQKSVDALQGALDLLDQSIFFACHHLILTGEAFLDINCHFILGKITNMPFAGNDFAVRGKEFRDGSGLGWRLDDYQCVGIIHAIYS